MFLFPKGIASIYQRLFLLFNLYYSIIQVFIGTFDLALCGELLLYYKVLWCVAGWWSALFQISPGRCGPLSWWFFPSRCSLMWQQWVLLMTAVCQHPDLQGWCGEESWQSCWACRAAGWREASVQCCHWMNTLKVHVGVSQSQFSRGRFSKIWTKLLLCETIDILVRKTLTPCS